MVNTKIKLITFFVAEDEETVNNQQKQDLELTGSDAYVYIYIYV